MSAPKIVPFSAGASMSGSSKIGHCPELVSSRRMPGNLDSERAQLLYQAPHFGAAGANLVGNLGSAHDYGRVLHQQPHNPPQAQIRPLRRKLVGSRAARRRALAWNSVL